MANAGNHNDTRILKRMIFEGKLIKISGKDYENVTVLRIKSRFNDLVRKDEVYTSSYMGKKYKGHKAWKYMDNVLRWANQTRWKFFNFEPLSAAELYKPKIK
jgi:hypothetical protein